MGFWQEQVIEPALNEQTTEAIREQREWILREPANPRPFYYLAQLYRTQQRREQALGLLLEAVRLDPAFARAHVALTEMYAVAGDSTAAERHARFAERHGDPSAADLLRRHGHPL
jgi:tetratricopeptide (TPR) repeat protein